MWMSYYFSTICWKDYTFPRHWIAFAPLSKISWLFVCIYFWVLYSLPLIYLSYCSDWNFGGITGQSVSADKGKTVRSSTNSLTWFTQRCWTISTVLLHHWLSLGARWHQVHLKCLFRQVWFWMVWKTTSTKSLLRKTIWIKPFLKDSCHVVKITPFKSKRWKG